MQQGPLLRSPSFLFVQEYIEQGLVLRSLSFLCAQEYVELHMEQGPVLEAARLPLGVVSAIAGQTRLWVVVNGTQVCIFGV